MKDYTKVTTRTENDVEGKEMDTKIFGLEIHQWCLVGIFMTFGIAGITIMIR